MMISRLMFAACAALLLGAASPPPAARSGTLSAAARGVLDAYVNALGAGRYGDAYALLTAEERKYFGSPANYASTFSADRLKIGKYKLLRVEVVPPNGVVAVVSEDVQFFDHAHQVTATATARVAYGLIDEHGKIRVKDPYHPWRAVAPKNATADVDGYRVTIRKLSFFTGRLEVLLTFANLSDATVTALPYGRSVLKDDAGQVQRLIATKIAGLTDKNLYLGLRLAASGQYTGALTFLTADRYAPKSLQLTVGKMLKDGGEEPFELTLPVVPIPPAGQ
ncbi:MAG: hypothetical protein GIW95_10430, partial [Candidatus Eremiobacteraeota bacterium]|nr:hypothetical protein [Candidatus Eremiobacteraeota bacterium]